VSMRAHLKALYKYSYYLPFLSSFLSSHPTNSVRALKGKNHYSNPRQDLIFSSSTTGLLTENALLSLHQLSSCQHPALCSTIPVTLPQMSFPFWSCSYLTHSHPATILRLLFHSCTYNDHVFTSSLYTPSQSKVFVHLISIFHCLQ